MGEGVPAHLQRKTFQALNGQEENDNLAKSVQLALQLLIVANALAIILESVESIHLRYVTQLQIFETFSIAVFSIEYLARLWVAPLEKGGSRRKFLLSPYSIIDLAAILPFYLPFISADLRFLRLLRLLRIFRILKLARYSKALRTMGRAFAQTKEQLAVTILGLAILLVIVSTLMYYTEHDAQPDKFPDIPSTMWWSIVTLTTVGYGDVYPITGWGKFLAAVVAFLGVGTFALPAGMIGSGFIQVLEDQRREEAPPQLCAICGRKLEQAQGKTGTSDTH